MLSSDYWIVIKNNLYRRAYVPSSSLDNYSWDTVCLLLLFVCVTEFQPEEKSCSIAWTASLPERGSPLSSSRFKVCHVILFKATPKNAFGFF